MNTLSRGIMGYKIINRNCNFFRGRKFRLLGPFNDSPKQFKCVICEHKGKKGYKLKDVKAEIKVGETCLDHYFIKSRTLKMMAISIE